MHDPSEDLDTLRWVTDELYVANETLMHFRRMYNELKKVVLAENVTPDNPSATYADGIRDMQERIKHILETSGV